MKKLNSYNFLFLTFLASLLIILNSCSSRGKIWDPADAREFPAEPESRVQKNLEEGRGFRIMDFNKNNQVGGSFEFATSNALWRATLDTLDFMPLATANYSGGLIITDWYSESNSQKETVKISVRFLSNEVRVDALDIKVFSKKCISFDDCSVLENKGVLIGELKKKILQKAAVYDTEIKAIQKKRRKVPKVKKVTKKQRRKKANKDKK